MLETINIKDILPNYIMVLVTLIASFGVFKLIIFFIGIFVVYVIFGKLLALLVSSKQKYSILEVKPSYKSLKSAFSTEKLFTILHTIQRPYSLIDRILGIKRSMSFELISTKEDGIRYIIRLPEEYIEIVKKALLAYVPSIEINEINDYLPSYNENVTVRQLKLHNSYIFPLQEQSVLKEFDPIGYLTAQMTKLEQDELIVVQIINTAVSASTHSKVIGQIRTLKQMLLNNEDISGKLQTGFVWFLLKIFYPSKKKRFSELSTSKQASYKSVEDKINQPLYETTIRLLVKSDNKQNSYKRIKGLLSSFETFTSPSQSIKLKSTINFNVLNKINYYFLRNRLFSLSDNLILSASELSSIYHFPYTNRSNTEDLIHTKSPKLPSPLSFKKSDTGLDIVFADNIYGETSTPIGLTLEERRRHMYVIGATGTGKTTLLLQMIYEDIKKGKGIAVLDPHGDLAERLIGVIPEKRVKDIVYFNPYDTEYPIGLNVLELAKNISEKELNREKDLIVSSLISVFHKLYPARYSGPRMEHVLRNTVLTALEVENPTLFTVYKLLTNHTYRKQIVETLTDPILKDFWKQEFEKLGSFQKADLISPITNKLGRFLTTSMTRNILNQKQSKLNFDEIINSGKILICDLSKGKIGEDTSSFLGSLILAKLQLAALNRVHIPMEKRSDFFLYIDEFQNFATVTFAQILSEARKYRLNTILAHQTISQIEDKDLLKVILANVGTIISFRTSNPSDEDFLLPLFTPQVEKNEISNLPSYNFYIKINALIPQDAFTGMISNFSVLPDNNIQQNLIEFSRNMYGLKQENKSEIKTNKSFIKKIKEVKKISSVSVKKLRVSI